MSQNNNIPKVFSIEKLFENGDYIIPVYQRNYAWGEKEINQLIDDIYDYCEENEKNNDKKNYYIGTLIVFKRDKAFEVIDGQQRLTTLFILMSVLNKLNESFRLKFESRERAEKTLQEIRRQEFKFDNYLKEELNINILNAYVLIQKRFKKLNEKFIDYFLDKVQILRIEVPEDTDLNHYFEIMNNRGEQLEKHEILKSRMLAKLKDDKQATSMFNTIWEACTNMERYVQYGFSHEQRKNIFGNNWNEFQKKSFDDLLNQSDQIQMSENASTIAELIGINAKKMSSPELVKDDDNPERFNAVINFSNFLLHVLRIQTNEDIPLDDKRLLETFNGKYESMEDVKCFGFNLLKMKFLFDNYIIKREYTAKGDEWSLKQLIKNDHPSKNNSAYYKNRFNDERQNKNILMLLSMFHVSAPTLIYKHWLNAALKYLFENSEIQDSCYISYLEKIANTYMKDRFLSISPTDYHEIIYWHNGESKNSAIDWNNLNQGTDVENYIFNYLDYLLWKNENFNQFKENFSFSFRSSVEHYYPQKTMKNIDKLDGPILNSFGNLCLVTSSENSRLSNFTPKAKKEFYSKQSNNSIKQRIMMKSENWTEYEIKKHQSQMIELLTNELL